MATKPTESTLLKSLIRLAYKEGNLRPRLLPLIKQAASQNRLPSSLRQKINQRLDRRGFGGKGVYRSVGQALGDLSEVLGEFGVQPDEIFSADRFRPKEQGTAKFDIAFDNPDPDPFMPGLPISNSVLVIQWYQHPTGNFEVLAYLS